MSEAGEAARSAVIFGLGDFARIAAVYLREDSPYSVDAFTVHERFVDRDELLGIPVVPFERLQDTHPPGSCQMLTALGYSRTNQARAEVYEECKQRGYEFLTYVNSGVKQWEESSIGENTFVFEDNVLQPFTTIGSNVVLWSGNHIGHDVTIGDHCFIASHVVISGNTTIGPYTFVGVNATFRDSIKVGARNVIGAGAVIMRDTEEGDVYPVRRTEAGSKKSWEIDF
jgi:sugar O-acyltransferase (sialic acid O-acetyltransferase NeuD family)